MDLLGAFLGHKLATSFFRVGGKVQRRKKVKKGKKKRNKK